MTDNSQILLIDPNSASSESFVMENEHLLQGDMGRCIEAKNGVFKFVNDNNYTANFGYQWNKFEKTQLDRYHQSVNQSTDRLFAVTDWPKGGLEDKNILEVGSGAGRFSRVVLEHTGANLYSVDYSNAVEANFRNNQHFGNRLKLFQASIYELPFKNQQFDVVFCFGVLQHTPDFKKSVECLCDMVKPGGQLFVDFYPVRGWWTKIHAKYIFRPLTKKMKHEKLLAYIEKYADSLISTYQFLDKLGLHVLTRFLPMCDIKNTLPEGLSNEELREWVILDTFDMFSPEYDNPKSMKQVEKWISKSKAKLVAPKIVRFSNNTVYAVNATF